MARKVRRSDDLGSNPSDIHGLGFIFTTTLEEALSMDHEAYLQLLKFKTIK